MRSIISGVRVSRRKQTDFWILRVFGPHPTKFEANYWHDCNLRTSLEKQEEIAQAQAHSCPSAQTPSQGPPLQLNPSPVPLDIFMYRYEGLLGMDLSSQGTPQPSPSHHYNSIYPLFPLIRSCTNMRDCWGWISALRGHLNHPHPMATTQSISCSPWHIHA